MNSDNIFVVLVICLALLTLEVDIYAQSPLDRIETAEKMKKLQKVMEQYEETKPDTQEVRESAVTDGGGDLGRQRILRRRSRHKYYSGAASMNLQSSDNANLAPDDSVFEPTSDASRVASVSGGYYFNLPNPYTAQLRGSYQAVSYFDEEFLNYDFMSLSANGRRSFTSSYGRTSLGLGYSYENLLYGAENENNDRLDSVQRQHIFSSSLRHSYPLNRYQFLSAGLNVENELTSHVDLEDISGKTEGGENDPEKTSATIDAMYRYQYSQKISMRSSYQFTRNWYRYQNNFGTTGDRQDYSHLVSAGMKYQLTDYLNLGLNVSYNENHSNFSSSEYDSFSGSFVLSTRTRF